MLLKPQDIVLALKLLAEGVDNGYVPLAKSLGMSASETHAGVRRLTEARLLIPGTKRVRRQPLRELLIHGLAYVFPAHLGSVVRGMPTAWAAPVFGGKVVSGEQLPPVWPDPEGTTRGEAVEPLYRSVPGAARRDLALYDLLALVDAIRVGRARERSIAADVIAVRLSAHAAA
jgi:hypothetical protein